MWYFLFTCNQVMSPVLFWYLRQQSPFSLSLNVTASNIEVSSLAQVERTPSSSYSLHPCLSTQGPHRPQKGSISQTPGGLPSSRQSPGGASEVLTGSWRSLRDREQPTGWQKANSAVLISKGLRDRDTEENNLHLLPVHTKAHRSLLGAVM